MIVDKPTYRHTDTRITDMLIAILRYGKEIITVDRCYTGNEAYVGGSQPTSGIFHKGEFQCFIGS